MASCERSWQAGVFIQILLPVLYEPPKNWGHFRTSFKTMGIFPWERKDEDSFMDF